MWQEQLLSSQNFKQCVQGLFSSGAYAILYSYALHMHLKFCHATLNLWLHRHTTGSVTVLFTSSVGEEPLKILKFSDTCWLSIAPCVQHVLDQYEELKLHFQLVKDEECNYTAELLYQMYCTPENKLYLLFLKPILLELN